MCNHVIDSVGRSSGIGAGRRACTFLAFLVLLGIVRRDCCAGPNLFPYSSATGRYLAFDTKLGELNTEKLPHLVVWDLRSGTEILKINTLNSVENCDVSEERELIAITGGNEELEVWSLETKERLWHYKKSHQYTIYQARFVANGEYLVVASNKPGQNLEVVRSRDGEKATKLVSSYKTGSLIQTSPDGLRLYVSQSTDDQDVNPTDQSRLTCFDVKTGKRLGAFKLSSSREPWFSVGSKFLVELVRLKETGGRGLIIWDTETYSEVRRIPIKGDDTYSLPFIDESTGSVYAATRVNDINEHYCQSLFQEVSLETGELIGQHSIVTGSISGMPRLTRINGSDAIAWLNDVGLNNHCFLAKYKRPSTSGFSLILQSLYGARNAVVFLPNRNAGIKYGSPENYLVYDKERDENRSIGSWETWRFRSNKWYDRNGFKFTDDPHSVGQVLANLREPTALPKQTINGHNLPRLFVLSIGISDYSFDEYDLQFAAKDAIAIADALASQKGKLFSDTQLMKLTDADATSVKIRDGLEWLKRSATENDVVVIYFSGHGLRAKRGLYMFTHDGDENDIYNTCVNWQDFAESVTATNSKAVLLLTDCCHAGSFSRERFFNQQNIADVLEGRDNVAILASSTGTEVSFEQNSLSQGVFTHAVLSAVSGGADSNSDNYVDWDELVKFVSAEVPRLTANMQHPQLVKSMRLSQPLRVASVIASKELDDDSKLEIDHILTSDSSLMRADKVVGKIVKGTKVRVGRVEGNWTLIAVATGETIETGWVRSTSVERLTNR